MNDVRVSPIDEGAGVVEEDELSRAARRPRTGANGSPPRSRRTTRSRRRENQKLRSPCTTWVPGGPPPASTSGPIRVRRGAISKFVDAILGLSRYPRVSVSFCQENFARIPPLARSSLTNTLANQHCTSGLIPSNSLHLLSCAQLTIVNHERVVDAPSCYVLFSTFLILSCSSAMRIECPCSSYAMYTPAAVRDVRQFVFLNLLPTGKPGLG